MEKDFGSWADTGAGERTIRVLHVEDDPSFADLTATFLQRESESFEIVSAHSAAEGLKRLAALDVDCIVSDYQMPGQNGLEFFERVRDEDSDIPFVLFTGKGSEEVASEAFSLGVTDYLQKEGGPDQFTVLANRIEQAVSAFRSQRRLERTRRRFKTLVEEANDAILVVDTTGNILYATPATRHILGKSPDDLVGTSGFDPIHPDDVDAVQAELAQLLADPEYRARVEFRYRHADGSWIWLEIRGRNLIDNDDIAGIVVYARDVDDRKEKELALERHEQTFQAMFENASDAIVVADDDGVCVDVNPAVCDLFGLERDDLVGRSIREFVPDDYDFEDAWQSFTQSDDEHGLFPLVRADGDRRLVEFAAMPDVPSGRNLAILCDVTEQDRTAGGTGAEE